MDTFPSRRMNGSWKTEFLSNMVSIFNKSPSFLKLVKKTPTKHCTNVPKLFCLIKLFEVPVVTRCWIALISFKITLCQSILNEAHIFQTRAKHFKSIYCDRVKKTNVNSLLYWWERSSIGSAMWGLCSLQKPLQECKMSNETLYVWWICLFGCFVCLPRSISAGYHSYSPSHLRCL